MKYFIGTVIIIFLILIGAVVLVSRPNNKNDDTSTSTTTTNTPSGDLTDYARPGTRVILTTDGIINGSDKHRVIRITISDSIRQIEIIQGYEGKVINQASYPNDSSAYEAFMHALANAKFITELKNAKAGDEKGACPTGLRYYYDLEDNSGPVKHLWSTSCGGAGNFAGNPSLARQLFRQQIPDYSKLTSGLSLYN